MASSGKLLQKKTVIPSISRHTCLGGGICDQNDRTFNRKFFWEERGKLFKKRLCSLYFTGHAAKSEEKTEIEHHKQQHKNEDEDNIQQTTRQQTTAERTTRRKKEVSVYGVYYKSDNWRNNNGGK